jgi:DNA-binding transcriptional regulator YiaG
MTYQLFQTALHWARESGDYEEFKHHTADALYAAHDERSAVEAIQHFVWDYAADRTADTLARSSGLTKSELARRYNLPLNTLQKWLYGGSTPSDYVLDLLAFAVLTDSLAG